MHDEAQDPEAAGPRGQPEDPAKRAERLEKRRQRLVKGAERLRERAAELRKKAAAGETVQAPPNSKRPPRSFEEQAKKFEDQAMKMEVRSKNLEAEDEARSTRPERSSDAIRQRRHKIRKAQLNRRWGETLRNPDAMVELRTHAERVAKLKRIRSLGQSRSKDDPIALRAGTLLAKEEARHELRMKQIQDKASGGEAKTQPASTAEEAK